jgi:plasmid stabilization system protein ParE
LYTLSPRAIADLRSILRRSFEQYGSIGAARLQQRLEKRFEGIAAGTVLGHRRHDVTPRRPIRFVTERPFVIAFDPDTKVILRIVHGARDMRRVFR